jgi:hypothetical protein
MNDVPPPTLEIDESKEEEDDGWQVRLCVWNRMNVFRFFLFI